MTGEMALITILVWNIHGLPLPFLTGGASPSAVERHIQHYRADVVLAQEAWTKGSYRALRRASWPFLFGQRMNRAGLVTIVGSSFGREPDSFQPQVESYGEFTFQKKLTSFSRLDFLARKGFQAAVVDGVLVINTHLDAGDDKRSSRVRIHQVDAIIQLISTWAGPVVLAGDLNLKPPYSLRDRATLAHLVDATGLVVNLNNGADYFMTRDVGIADMALLTSGPSDHKPMLVTIKVPR